MAENEEGLKSHLMRLNEESEKAGLKLNIKKTKIMASSGITLRQIERERVKAGAELLDFQITADSDYSLEIRICLLLRRKDMVNLATF